MMRRLISIGSVFSLLICWGCQYRNNWDIFGRAVSGTRKGDRLKHTRSFMGYWFSFAAFYPNVTIYGAS